MTTIWEVYVSYIGHIRFMHTFNISHICYVYVSYINLRLSHIKHISVTYVSYRKHIWTHIYSYRESATFIVYVSYMTTIWEEVYVSYIGHIRFMHTFNISHICYIYVSYINLRLSHIKHISVTYVSFRKHIWTHMYSYRESATFIMYVSYMTTIWEEVYVSYICHIRFMHTFNISHICYA